MLAMGTLRVVTLRHAITIKAGLTGCKGELVYSVTVRDADLDEFKEALKANDVDVEVTKSAREALKETTAPGV